MEGFYEMLDGKKGLEEYIKDTEQKILHFHHNNTLLQKDLHNPSYSGYNKINISYLPDKVSALVCVRQKKEDYTYFLERVV